MFFAVDSAFSWAKALVKYEILGGTQLLGVTVARSRAAVGPTLDSAGGEARASVEWLVGWEEASCDCVSVAVGAVGRGEVCGDFGPPSEENTAGGSPFFRRKLRDEASGREDNGRVISRAGCVHKGPKCRGEGDLWVVVPDGGMEDSVLSMG